MEAISVNVVSTETIKPHREHHLPDQPFWLSLLDQFVPLTYTPYIFFYSAVQNDQNALISFPDRLRTSLSLALARFPPLSGRLGTDRLSIVDFHLGVPFKTARVNCQMSKFLTETVMSCLNHFRLFCNEKSKSESDIDLPMLGVQVSMFSCGGVAVGVSVCHAIADAATSSAFLSSWAAITRGESPTVDYCDHDLRIPASVASADKVWSCGGHMRAERFVFDEEALAALKTEARSDVVFNPTRVEAVSALIWRSAIRAVPSSKTRVMTHAVNMRPRKHSNGHTTGYLKGTTILGNLILYANAVYNSDRTSNAADPKLPELVELVSESISKVNNDHARSVRGTEALELVVGNLKEMEGVLSYEDLELMVVSSWVNMGFGDVDFGLGKPVWVGLWGHGEGGPEFITNVVVLNDATWCRGIEAWVNLDEKVLEFMRNDPEFLRFAAVDPPIPFFRMKN